MTINLSFYGDNQRLIKKISFVVASIFLIITLFNTPLTLAQTYALKFVQIRAYAANYTQSEDFFVRVNATINFTVASPPVGENQGSVALYNNTIIFLREDIGKNVTMILSWGDEVSIMRGENFQLGGVRSSDPDIETISYIGNANMVVINGFIIPEYPSWIILPFLLVSSLCMVIFSKKLFNNRSK